ncbi:MAG: hypothetical protein Q4D54_02285 [Eubacteriales bacterium]|nr:hypothetical protein [Eubacteriales bacterium]
MPEKGEDDFYTVYAKPDEWVLEKLLKYKTRTELWGDLPVRLKYIDEKK